MVAGTLNLKVCILCSINYVHSIVLMGNNRLIELRNLNSVPPPPPPPPPPPSPTFRAQVTISVLSFFSELAIYLQPQLHISFGFFAVPEHPSSISQLILASRRDPALTVLPSLIPFAGSPSGFPVTAGNTRWTEDGGVMQRERDRLSQTQNTRLHTHTHTHTHFKRKETEEYCWVTTLAGVAIML